MAVGQRMLGGTLHGVGSMCVFFFFKQKTAYEIRPRDWSSDVCSSDLAASPKNVETPISPPVVAAPKRELPAKHVLPANPSPAVPPAEPPKKVAAAPPVEPSRSDEAARPESSRNGPPSPPQIAAMPSAATQAPDRPRVLRAGPPPAEQPLARPPQAAAAPEKLAALPPPAAAPRTRPVTADKITVIG